MIWALLLFALMLLDGVVYGLHVFAAQLGFWAGTAYLWWELDSPREGWEPTVWTRLDRAITWLPLMICNAFQQLLERVK